VLLAAALGSSHIAAQDLSQPGVEWQCLQKFDEFFHILCVPEPTGAGSIAPEALGGIVDAPSARRTSMRPVATVRRDEAFFTTDQLVPLYAPPRDRALVSQLLQSVLCDQAQRCSVIYHGY
jgi:hypothetical protein